MKQRISFGSFPRSTIEAEPRDKTYCPLLDYLSYKYSLKSSKGDSFNSQSRNHIFHSLDSRHHPGTRLTSLLPPCLQADEKLARAVCCSSLVCLKGKSDDFIYVKPEYKKFACKASDGQ